VTTTPATTSSSPAACSSGSAPTRILSTQCSGFYDSVLDFVFVGGDAREWAAESVILRPDDTYCSGSHRDTWSDHRPVRADLAMPVE
jgi:hypothetical protein